MSFPTRRLRRLRTSSKMRELIQQTTLSPKDFICPVFVQEDL
ncbi:MAG: porphobilinogen synthase, partial [Nitrosopumilus sp.]